MKKNDLPISDLPSGLFSVGIGSTKGGISMTSINLGRLYSGILCGLLLLMISLPVFGTTGSNSDLVGAWEGKGQGFTISFSLNADGTGMLDDTPITYAVKSQHLLVTIEGELIDYTFKLSQGQLTLADGDLDGPTVFTRKGGSKKGIGAIKSGKTAAEPMTDAGSAIAGTWTIQAQSGVLTLDLKADGGGAFNAIPLQWQYNQKNLILMINGQTVMYNAALAGDNLTLSGGDLQQPATFQRSGSGHSGPGAAARAEAKSRPASGSSSIAGAWTIQAQNGLLTLDLKADGSGAFNGTPLAWQYSQKILIISINGQTVRYNVSLAGNALTLSGGDLPQGATFRRGGSGSSQTMAAPSGPVSQVAGVWVGEESSLDPQYYMSYTQYVILYADGSVGYGKAEGGATRAAVSEYIERFSSYNSGRQGSGGNYGRWETDGRNIAIYWNRWNNLVSRGQVNGGVMRLSGMGVLQEGSAVEFKRQ